MRIHCYPDVAAIRHLGDTLLIYADEIRGSSQMLQRAFMENEYGVAPFGESIAMICEELHDTACEIERDARILHDFMHECADAFEELFNNNPFLG